MGMMFKKRFGSYEDDVDAIFCSVLPDSGNGLSQRRRRCLLHGGGTHWVIAVGNLCDDHNGIFRNRRIGWRRWCESGLVVGTATENKAYTQSGYCSQLFSRTHDLFFDYGDR
jgi:hypothetical protein